MLLIDVFRTEVFEIDDGEAMYPAAFSRYPVNIT